METDRLTTADVAALLGIEPATWRNYVSRRHPRGNPAPVPDGHHDRRTPYWLRSTIDAWAAERPGRGSRTDLHREHKAQKSPRRRTS